MTFRALALRQSESMDFGLCMAHTDQTHHRNSGATVLCSVFMFPCSVFLPEALFHHVIYNTDSKPLACPPNVSFSYLYGWSNFWFLSNLWGFVSVLLCRMKNSWKHENVWWLQNWKRRRFGRVSRTLEFSKLKSWTSPKPFSSCLKPLFQSEASSETRCIDMKKIFYSHANKMAVFMPTLTSSCVVHTHLTDDFNV